MTVGGTEAMLSLVRKHWYSWNFRLEDGTGQSVAEIKLSFRPWRATATTGGLEYEVSWQGRTGLVNLIRKMREMGKLDKVSWQGLMGQLILAEEGIEVARAKHLSWREFSIIHGGAEYMLRKSVGRYRLICQAKLAFVQFGSKHFLDFSTP